MTEFKITEPGKYKTRDGRKAVVAAIAASLNVVAGISHEVIGWTDGYAQSWSSAGNLFGNEAVSPRDIVSKCPKKRGYWVNFYSNDLLAIFSTKDEANKYDCPSNRITRKNLGHHWLPRIACKYVEFEEGEGL